MSLQLISPWPQPKDLQKTEKNNKTLKEQLPSMKDRCNIMLLTCITDIGEKKRIIV